MFYFKYPAFSEYFVRDATDNGSYPLHTAAYDYDDVYLYKKERLSNLYDVDCTYK